MTPSSFCAQPSLLDMIFYGQNDIMLGEFLEYYCFRSSYMCPSCNLPMLGHVRRYAHSLGCVQVKLTEDLTAQNVNQILMTSMCTLCEEMTPSVPMSKDTWCLSFAKYLELRFHGHAYKRRIVDMADNKENTNEMQTIEAELSKRQCAHSIHKDHVQFFSYNGIVASFKYTQLEAWEIGMPSMILQLRSPQPLDQFKVLEDIKNFALKGYEVYAHIHDVLADLSSEVDFPMLGSLKQTLNRDQMAFREKVGVVQTLLTASVVIAYDVTDAVLIMKKLLAESTELWVPRLQEAAIQSRTTYAAKHETPALHLAVDSGIVCTEDLRPDISLTEDEQETIEDSETSDSREKQSSSGDSSPNKHMPEAQFPSKDSTDKKSVKKLLRELLPSAKNVYVINSPIPSNEHHSLPLGQFPVLVQDQDLSSVIAHSLMSNEYKRALEIKHSAGHVSDIQCSPSIKRKSQEGLADFDERELVDKKSKTTHNPHIEVYFQDLTTQFTCKIYFAREFDTMRTNCIKPAKIERGFKETFEPEKKNVQRMQSQPDLDPLKIGQEFDDSVANRKSSTSSLTPNMANRRSDSRDSLLQQDTEDVRSSFARSLCESVHWDARGGKSGSKFCKTKGMYLFI